MVDKFVSKILLLQELGVETFLSDIHSFIVKEGLLCRKHVPGEPSQRSFLTCLFIKKARTMDNKELTETKVTEMDIKGITVA